MSDDVHGEDTLLGGRVSAPVRIHGNVHRDAGPWTPAVHELLRHLEHAGFDGAPRVVGFDGEGRDAWATLLEDGQLRMFETVASWIAANRVSLL